MKQISFFKLFTVILFILSIFTSANIAFADDPSDPCSGKPQIEFNTRLDTWGRLSALDNYLTSYSSIVGNDNGSYYLNFNRDREINVNHTLSISLADDSDLYICNLTLKRLDDFAGDSPLLLLSGTSTTNHIHLYNVSVTGNASKSGPCLTVAANGATVAASTFSNCSEGIRIEASNTLLGPSDAAGYAQEKNTLTGNTIGIHQVSGAGNRWPYNSICGGNGIVVDGGARPALHVTEGSVANLQCERSGEITNRCRLQFDSVLEVTGEVEIYGAEAAGCDLQGRDYIAKCTPNSDNSCIFDASNSVAAVSHIECGPRKCRFTAFFTDTSSSMYVSEPFVLNVSPWSTVIIADVPGPMDNPSVRDPGHSNSGDDSGDLSDDGSDRLALNDPTFDPATTDDTEDRGAGATAADGGPASAARCTMIPSALFNSQHAAVSFIFLALPALFITALRQKNRRKFS